MLDIEPATDIVSLTLGDSRESALSKDATEDVTVVLSAKVLQQLKPLVLSIALYRAATMYREATIFKTRTLISIVQQHFEYSCCIACSC
jgi:hypothetical protein